MAKLEKGLPKVVQTVLENEDEEMKALVAALISGVIRNHGKSNPYPPIKNILDTEIEKIQVMRNTKKIIDGEY